MFQLRQYFFSDMLKNLLATAILLSIWPAGAAQAAEDPQLIAAKATHAEIVGSTPKAEAKKEIKPESRRIGTATPDEVAVRIAAKLAQLSLRQAASKTVEKRRVQQISALPRHATPAPTRQSVVSCPSLPASSVDTPFI